MRVKSLKISNVLSYGLIADFENAENTIEFKDDLNILIGSNGSGKSNLLEVVNKLFQGHFFKNYFIDDNSIFNEIDKKAIKENTDRTNNVINTLFRNFNHRNEESKIEVELSPDEGDIKNLKFLYDRWDEIKSLGQEYCNDVAFFNFKKEFDEKSLCELKSCKFLFRLNNASARTMSMELKSSIQSVERFFYLYLVYFNQIQTLFEFLNYHKKGEYDLLKNSFALISSMRTYGGFTNQISLGVGINEQIKSANQQDASHSTKSYGNTDYIFRVTSLRLGQQLRKWRNNSGTEKSIQKCNEPGSILAKINSVMQSSLGFSLKLEDFNEATDIIKLQIYKESELVQYNELSMGQKSIFYLLFAIYGYDLKDGLLVIDEPELHLHVSMQKKYFDIIKKVCNDANLQIILATHSSVFVDEKTIKNTFRFFKEKDYTSIVWPPEITQSQKDLIKILTYTNSSRVFFSDDVILVEGDSDEYFFNFFYSNYIKTRIQSDKIIEILYIGGKGNYEKWKEFLDLFKINAYFIGDFDNIKEHGVIQKTGINWTDLQSKAKEQIISKINKDKIVAKPTLDGKELLKKLDEIVAKDFELSEEDETNLKGLWLYLIEKQGLKRTHIIDYLQGENSDGYKKIIDEIDALYEKKIFILKQGDLEDYLDISKDLSNVIKFCEDTFEQWRITEECKGENSRLKELTEIFNKILN